MISTHSTYHHAALERGEFLLKRAQLGDERIHAPQEVRISSSPSTAAAGPRKVVKPPAK